MQICSASGPSRRPVSPNPRLQPHRPSQPPARVCRCTYLSDGLRLLVLEVQLLLSQLRQHAVRHPPLVLESTAHLARGGRGTSAGQSDTDMRRWSLVAGTSGRQERGESVSCSQTSAKHNSSISVHRIRLLLHPAAAYIIQQLASAMGSRLNSVSCETQIAHAPHHTSALARYCFPGSATVILSGYTQYFFPNPTAS